jgi:phenylpyruvate tautomerase PptA (4-oxalocrotonate tautomerase family)
MKTDSIIRVLEAVVETIKVIIDECKNDKEEGDKDSKK